MHLWANSVRHQPIPVITCDTTRLCCHLILRFMHFVWLCLFLFALFESFLLSWIWIILHSLCWALLPSVWLVLLVLLLYASSLMLPGWSWGLLGWIGQHSKASSNCAKLARDCSNDGKHHASASHLRSASAGRKHPPPILPGICQDMADASPLVARPMLDLVGSSCVVAMHWHVFLVLRC